MSLPSKLRVRNAGRMFSWLALTLAMGGTTLWAQATVGSFGVGKKLDYLQNAATTPASHIILGDPNGPFHFSADISGSNLNLVTPAPKVTLPSATQYTLTGNNVSMGLATSYSSKVALDGAFPNGSYTIVVAGSSLPISLGTSDAYPAEIPQITNGTWDGQGRLVVNSAGGTTLNFNSFSDYATGVGGTITFNLYTISGTAIGSEVVRVDSVALSGYSSDAALTSYSIPAGLLQADRTYYAELSFSRIVSLNTNFLASLGASGVASYMNTTGLIISTAASVVAPAITTQPLSQTVIVGANITLTVAASGNPAPTFQWRKEGVSINGATYSSFSVSNAQLVDAGSYTVVASNGAGITTSDAAVVTVNPPPVAPAITTQPPDQTVIAGQSASFGIVTTGTAPLSYQWKKDGANIMGATSSTFMLVITGGGDAGSYTVVVTNAVGSVTSNGASLTVNPLVISPIITTQPQSQTIVTGGTVTFTAAVSGTPTPTLQWQKNGSDIAGANSSSFTMPGVTGSDAGSYRVIATNSGGVATSDVALLAVIAAPSVVAPSDAIVSFTVE